MPRSMSWFKSRSLFLSPRAKTWAGCCCLHRHIKQPLMSHIPASQATFFTALPVYHTYSTSDSLYVPLSIHDHRITTVACHRYKDKQSTDRGQGHLTLTDTRDGLRTLSVFQRTTASDLPSR